MTEPRDPPGTRPRADPTGTVAEFEGMYRSEVGVVTSYFARRTDDPQTTADLTADTFVAAITSFGTFDRRKGTPRAWLLGIARRVFAQHCESVTRSRDVVVRLDGHRVLDTDEIAELLARIDAERVGRGVIEALGALSALDREVIELVDIVGLTPKEAAAALGMSPGALRIRLFRVRGKVRRLAEGAAEGSGGGDE